MTTKTTLAKLSRTELLELRKRVDDAIGRRHNEERQELAKQLSNVAKLIGAKIGSTPAQPARTQRVSARKGKKVKAKYRNPERRDETWAGRGRQPLWLVRELAEGKQIESFLIR